LRGVEGALPVGGRGPPFVAALRELRLARPRMLRSAVLVLVATPLEGDEPACWRTV
jgi:hypothetical protein